MNVGAWLDGLGLGQYARAFANNDIDGAALRVLTDRDLRALGVRSFGHRKKLLGAIAEISATAEQAVGPRPESYTPRHLAARILASRSALEGERKQVTVLFADVVGSTQLIEGMDPELAAARLSPALQAMMTAVHRYEGTVNKVQGDGIMALFGAPLAHEDHALRACLAALAMQQAIRQHLAGEVGIRVGLHSGEVVVRSIGNDLSMDYDAIGPTVHLARRMEQMASPGTIKLTGDTIRLVEGFVRAKPLGLTPVKGMSGSIELYELVGASLRSAWDVRAARGLSAFVGRDTELAVLRRALGEAEAGEGRVVAIVGEPGLGKSRLAHEFAHAATAEGWTVHEAGASPYDRNTTYFPIRGLLRAWFGVSASDTQAEIAEKLKGGLVSLDPDLLEYLPALGSLLDLPSEEAWQDLEPAQRRRRTIQAVKTLLLRRAQAGRLLILVEDLHWSDGETQAVLDSLHDDQVRAQLLLVLTYRPEYRPDWREPREGSAIRLQPLAATVADRLLQTLLGGGKDLTVLRRLLVDRTDGTPLFMEEAVRSMIENGTLAGERGDYRLAAPIDEIRIPTTVQAVLAARIDRIPARARSLLQIASVVGAEVPVELLQSISDLPEHELQDQLAELRSSELLYEAHAPPELSYSFKHALIHDVAYRGMLLERRRALHARLVVAIETCYRKRLDEHTERLAHHAWVGEVWDKAAAYLRQAGDRAIERSAYRQAAGFFRQALEALARLPASDAVTTQAIDLRIKLRPTLVPIGESSQVLDYLREAERLACAAGDSARLVLVLIHQSYFHSVQGSVADAISAAQQAAPIVATLADKALTVETRMALGQAYCYGGEPHRVIEALMPDLDYLTRDCRHERFGQIMTRSVMALSHLATAHGQLGELEAAGNFHKSACIIAQEVNRPLDRGLAGLGTGSFLLLKGEIEDALAIFEHTRAVAQSGEISYSTFGPLDELIGYARALRGEGRLARSILEQAIETSDAAGLIRHATEARAFLSYACLRCGAYGDAAAQAREALLLARQYRFMDVDVLACRFLGMSEMAGKLASGEAHLLEAVALAEARAMRPELAHGHFELGMLLAVNGRRDEARRHLTLALALYRAMDMRLGVEHAATALVDLS
jgi:class 3 adenylate cyclase/tetratricopeptide (TPR) repeat protein